MCFVLRNGGVRNCSSPFIDSETEAQSGNKQHRFIHSAIHSLTHLFIHSFILKCFWEPPKPRLSLKPHAKELKGAHLRSQGGHSQAM